VTSEQYEIKALLPVTINGTITTIEDSYKTLSPLSTIHFTCAHHHTPHLFYTLLPPPSEKPFQM